MAGCPSRPALAHKEPPLLHTTCLLTLQHHLCSREEIFTGSLLIRLEFQLAQLVQVRAPVSHMVDLMSDT